jgi:hypothetical protein
VKISRISAAAAAAALAAVMGALPASAASAAPGGGHAPAPQAPAAGSTGRSLLDQCSAAFFEGDNLLGPAVLPLLGPVGAELFGYRRTGGLSPAHFLAAYYDQGAGSWIYPPDNGYVIGPGGQPEMTQVTLRRGQDVDRYGSEFGAFLAPAGAPYPTRSIPPQNLDSTPAASCNYHDYAVVKPFRVDAGPVAPWFAQRGGGLQYQLDAGLVPGPQGQQFNVMWLVSNGYLGRLP